MSLSCLCWQRHQSIEKQLSSYLYAQKLSCSYVYTFWVIKKMFSYKLSCEISSKDSTSIIWKNYSQYCFWVLIVDSLSVCRSCDRSHMQNSHMMTNIKIAFHNSESIHPMNMNFFAYRDGIKHSTCSFQNLHKLWDMANWWNLIILVGVAPHKACLDCNQGEID